MGSHQTQLMRFLDDPARFGELVSEFNDEIDCYKSLRDEAKQSIPSFDEYMQFYKASIEHGPTGFVYSDLNKNAERSIKNMVLQSSKAGRRFPVQSAAELQNRIEKYRKLTQKLTQRSVVFTILEHIFDNEDHRPHAYKIIDNLLTETPDCATELVAILARARFVIGVEEPDHEAIVQDYKKELVNVIPNCYPDDERSASKLLEASGNKPYSDPAKLKLTQTALANGGGSNALEQYLYLSARDVAERYRHRDRTDPWRGELQLTELQFNSLTKLYSDDWSEDRKSWVNSYCYLIKAELESGGRWRSNRDGRRLPESNFFAAGNKYVSAADEIQFVNPSRHIKYLSKGIRHHAAAVQKRDLGINHGWTTSQLVHSKAVDIIIQLASNYDNPDDGFEDTVAETVAIHTFYKHQAAAVAAFENRNPREAFERIDKMKESREAVNIKINDGLTEVISKLAEALLLESENEFEQAREKYNSISHPKINIKKRVSLAEIKNSITIEDYARAVTLVKEEFEDASPVVAAVQIIANEPPDSPSVYEPVLEGLSAVDQECKWSLTIMSYICSSSNSLPEAAKREIKNLFLRL